METHKVAMLGRIKKVYSYAFNGYSFKMNFFPIAERYAVIISAYSKIHIIYIENSNPNFKSAACSDVFIVFGSTKNKIILHHIAAETLTTYFIISFPATKLTVTKNWPDKSFLYRSICNSKITAISASIATKSFSGFVLLNLSSIRPWTIKYRLVHANKTNFFWYFPLRNFCI